MKEMVWDSELAVVAQAHADQCVFEHDCSDCRRVERFGVGQNLYIYKQSLRRAATDWERAITDWYEEVTIFSNKKVEPFKFRAAIGHYSQMVWADTDKVGCGATSYREGKWFSTLYTCNYGPNGNYIRGQMYRQGTSCSACPQDSYECSQEYPGLCSHGNTSVSLFVPTLPTRRPVPTRTTQRTTTARRSTTTERRRTAARTTTTVASTSRRPIVTTQRITTTDDLANSVSENNPSATNGSSKSLLFSCNFDTLSDDCLVKNTGTSWQFVQTGGNSFYTAALAYRDKTDLFLKTMISPPVGGVACLHFKYKKYSSSGNKSALTVIAWPFRGKPGKISVFRDSPGQSAWVRAQITFRKIDNYFLVVFRAGGPATREDVLHVAVDDVRVVQGVCREG
eukprot:GFUD01018723.1.p1 GENE.GFUD01018723.1~~GFUD01018723.1.p1  ORF type:complete len:419 (+),score=119.43 GFUD01018723.1:73-1257(+)